MGEKGPMSDLKLIKFEINKKKPDKNKLKLIFLKMLLSIYIMGLYF